MKTRFRSIPMRLVLTALAVMCAGAAASVLAAAPAHAYEAWEHDHATDCADCHEAPGPVESSKCTFCHGGFRKLESQTCWTCHYPGEDTSAWRVSAGCASACHLWDERQQSYSIAFSHGAVPHDGADYAPCTDCHGVSVGVADPDGSPHHSGVPLPVPTCQDCHNGVIASFEPNHDDVSPACTSCHEGMNRPDVPQSCYTCHAAARFGSRTCTDCHSETGVFHKQQIHNAKPQAAACGTCHGGYQRHAGSVSCTQCHTKVAAFHHKVSSSAGKKLCRACHAKRHAGRAIRNSKCASCHKGRYPKSRPRAQHSTRITRRVSCTSCHRLQVHAKAYRASMTCGTCHKGRFHGRPSVPTSRSCLTCHGSAGRHAVGYPCLYCHRGTVHDATPSAGSR